MIGVEVMDRNWIVVNRYSRSRKKRREERGERREERGERREERGERREERGERREERRDTEIEVEYQSKQSVIRLDQNRDADAHVPSLSTVIYTHD